MRGPRRLVGLLALALAVAALSFVAGRATRSETPTDAPSAPKSAQAELDVSVPALAVSKSVPALKDDSAPATSGTAQATPSQPGAGSSPSAGSAAPSGGGPVTPEVVGGGTE